MQKEDVMPFLGKNVKLVFGSGFFMNGKIVNVSDEAVFLTTYIGVSAFSLGNLRNVLLNDKNE